MTLWIIWKKSIIPLIELDPEDEKNAQGLDDGTTGDNYIRVEMAFRVITTSGWRCHHDRQYQFKVPFMLYSDFESILKPVDEWYRDRINTMKTDRKSKASYTGKINTHVPSGWCAHSTFVHGDVPDPLKMYWGKDCVEKFVEYIEEGVQQLYETFPRQPMTKLTDVLKREHEAAKKCHICLKEFNDPRNKKVRDHCHYTSLY